LKKKRESSIRMSVSSVMERKDLEEGAERGHARKKKPQRCISSFGTRIIPDPSHGAAN
jgi:hypothetical protein